MSTTVPTTMENFEFRFAYIDGYTATAPIGSGSYGDVYLMEHPNPKANPAYCVKIEKRNGKKQNIDQACRVWNKHLRANVRADHLPLLPKPLLELDTAITKLYPRFHAASRKGTYYVACSMGYAPDLRTTLKKLKPTDIIDTASWCLQVMQLHKTYKDRLPKETQAYFFDANITNYGWFNNRVVFLELSDFYPYDEQSRADSVKLPQAYTLYRQIFTPSSAPDKNPNAQTITVYGDEPRFLKKLTEVLKNDYYFDLVAVTPVLVTVAEIICARIDVLLARNNDTEDADSGKIIKPTRDKIVAMVGNLYYDTFADTNTNEHQQERYRGRLDALLQCVLYLLYLLFTPDRAGKHPHDPLLKLLFPDAPHIEDLFRCILATFKDLITANFPTGKSFDWNTPGSYLELAEAVAKPKAEANDDFQFFAGFTDRCLAGNNVRALISADIRWHLFRLNKF